MLDRNDHVVEHVDAYLHDLLSPEDAATFDAHCADCEICQLALEEGHRRVEVLRALPPVEAPEALVRRAQSGIEHYQRRRRRLVPLGWAAAAVFLLAFGGLHAYYFTLSPTAYDLRILGQSELVADSGASLRVILIDHDSGRPVPDVPVAIDLTHAETNQSIRLVSFTTDQWGSGSPSFRLPDWEAGEYQLHVSAQPGWGQEELVRTVRLTRSWQLMLSSDKPVYQPGQVIRLRSLALAQPERKPVAGHDVAFAIRDPKGNVIFRKQDVTSRFGIASADCPLADEIIEGAYQVECQVGDTTSALSLEVKRYVLPKFEVRLMLDRPYYEPGQRAHGTVDAQYFFGKSVAEAEVDIAVETRAVTTETVERLSLRTDAAGVAEFEFTVPEYLVGREQRSGDAAITLRATVVDSAGQEGTRALTRVVTAEPIRVEVMPESGRLVRGVANVVYLLTSYPDGRPAPTRLAISGIHRELQTNHLGLATVEITPQADKTTWTIRATDDQGLVGRRKVTMRCGTAADDFLIRTDAAVYDGGQTLHLVALGGGKEPVFLDVLHDGQTMLTDLIPMRDGRGEYAFDLPPNISGTVELSAYRYGAAGLPVLKTQVIYVRPARAVNVAARLDRAEYRPGERATIEFTLTDELDRPAPGALSLAAVDEAVFSVLGQPTGMERTFFTLQQELLEPVYAIYPWSPDMRLDATAAERSAYEKALFSVAGRPVADRDAVLRQVIEEYGEGCMGLLDVLDRPDFEQLLESVWVPEDMKPLLLNRGGVHTLKADSYPAKIIQAERRRKEVAGMIHTAWIGLVLIGILGLLWFTMRSLANAVVALMIGALLIALLLPATQAAREASRRSSAVNDIRQLGLSFELAKQRGDLPTMQAPADGPLPPRVREWFPETLLWRPELVTDDRGRATLEVDLADSITTWRLSASAVTADGQLGAAEEPIRVFQPFFVDLNLPVALTRGDEITVPVVVYNYLDEPQTVELTLADGEWFELSGDADQKVELAAGEVRSVGYRIRAEKVGRFELQVSARAGGVADAVKRPIEVEPDGSPVELVFNGTLRQPVEIPCSVPPRAIEGSVRAVVKFYPSSFSQVVEGLDAIFQRPYGCFEQTSSTTYPNVLALDYLRQNKQSLPEVEAKARQYIHLGYQRLLGFEVAGGGFDWFGHPPANQTLTAYGLMEFRDMARVHDVDPQLIERTRRWLVDRQRSEGSWDPDRNTTFHEDPTRASRTMARLATTAYVAWAVFEDGRERTRADAARRFLLGYPPESIDDAYVLALVANALSAIDFSTTDAVPYVDRLEQLRRSSDDGKLAWWDAPSGSTMFYGAGRGGSVETTALAAMALLRTGRHPATAHDALAWLVERRDGGGTWHSTQATVLALKALLAGAGRPLGDGQPRRLEVRCDGQIVRDLKVPAGEADVVQQIDVSSLVAEGSHTLTLAERSDGAAVYQVSLRYHVPTTETRPTAPGDADALSLEVTYDQTELSVNDTVGVAVRVVNATDRAAPMVLLDLPIPPGFAIEADALAAMTAAGAIAKYQLTPRCAIVYLRQLAPERPLVLRYRLRATMPVEVTSPVARAYEYYNPDRQAAAGATRLTVTGE